MVNSDRTTIAAGRTEAQVAMDVQFEPYEHLRNAKRYLHGEPQTQLYKKHKDLSPEVRAHWQACRILERAGEKVLNDIEKRLDKRRAASERERKRNEIRKEKEIRAAIDTLLKYTGGIRIKIC